jgi:hypothetical protein
MLFRGATMLLAIAAFLFSTLSSHSGARVALIISYLHRTLGRLMVDGRANWLEGLLHRWRLRGPFLVALGRI